MFIAALTQDLYPRVTRQYPYPPLTRPVVRGYGTRTGTGTGGPQSTRTRPVLCPMQQAPIVARCRSGVRSTSSGRETHSSRGTPARSPSNTARGAHDRHPEISMRHFWRLADLPIAACTRILSGSANRRRRGSSIHCDSRHVAAGYR